MPIGFVGGGGGSSPEELFRSIPPVSKVILVSMVATVLGTVLNIFGPEQIALIWPLVRNKFHIWRLFTCAIFPGMPGIGALFTTFSMGMYSIRLEQDGFNMGGGGGSADFAYTIIFGLVVMETLILLLFYSPVFIMTEAFLSYICYVWSRKHPGMSVSLWGIVISAVYVPWVMLVIKLLMGGSIFQPLLGIVVGHLFYFLVDILPDSHDIDVLTTPKFLVNLLGFGRDGVAAVGAPAAAMPAPGVVGPPRDIPRTGRGNQWGTGRTLGSS